MPVTRRRALTFSLIAVTLGVMVVLVIASFGTRFTPALRDRVVASLNQRFKSQVNVRTLQVAAFPRPEVSGTGLELRHQGRTDVPPLITVAAFTGGAGLAGLYQTPLHLRSVTLEGLQIRLPPGGLKISTDSDRPTRRRPSLVVDHIQATDARLELASKKAGKPPRIFDIHHLVMDGFRPDAPATFEATLTNPLPNGVIDTDGTFGPWLAEDPQRTAVSGRYVFQNANLDDIKGLGGHLTSYGNYTGVLERIEVSGQTDSPDFEIDLAHQPVALKTRFSAVVDGTNGDTFLELVEATLAETLIVAKGTVVRAQDIKGRHITLDVTVQEGRIEDLLRLAIKPTKTPPLVGRVALKTQLLIPAGDADVVDKMQLNGDFSLSQARFTSYNVQKRINIMSRKARGDEGDDTAPSVVSNVSGRFVLRNAALTFTQLTFSVPGATVQLAGSYGLRSEVMDFKGNLLLDSSLADTTSGIKSMVARIVQPLFRRPGGGSKLPIKVSGSRDKPSFGLDVRRAFLPGD